MNESTTATFEGIYCKEILNAMNPERMYPRWKTRWSGYHYEEPDCEDCNGDEFDCQECEGGGMVPDKDAVEYYVWVPFAPTLFGLLPKKPWRDSKWNTKKAYD